MNSRARKKERGVALVMALLALVLLSAIGITMISIADTETKIGSNYRDKQRVTFAALAGLQEARDRISLDPSSPDAIVPPSGLPSLSSPNVIYIINPSPGEVVAPWDPNNKYADTELCHERAMGLTGTTNVRCQGNGSLPSGNSWYTVIDNSAVGYTGNYKLNPPLPYKWVRITAKANNSTVFPANKNPNDSSVMCWDGKSLVPMPPLYTFSANTCSPGSVNMVVITNAGSGYTSAPTVSFSGGGGTGAAATANISSSAQVIAVNVTNGGSGYSTPPLVTLSGGGGSGASVSARISGHVAGITVTAGGSGYKPGTCTAIFSGGGGSGATGTATISVNQGTKYLSSITLTNAGSGYTSAPSVTLGSDCGSGAGAQATATISGSVTGVTIVSGGSSYTSAPSVSFTGGGGSGAAATAQIGFGVSSVTITNGGTGYTSEPTVTISGGGGSGATGVAHITGGSRLGRVYVLTALAMSKEGGRAMSQMEAANAVHAYSLPGALTLDGPSPTFLPGSSNNFAISGADNNAGCTPPHPTVAVGVADQPADSEGNSPAVTTVLNAIPQQNAANYTGLKPSPDVENVYGALGDLTTVTGVNNLMQNILSVATYSYTGALTDATLPMGTAANPVINYVNGNVTINGTNHGYGILAVTGDLIMSGNFAWDGIIFVIGKGNIIFNGGGNLVVTGSVFIANTIDSNGNQMASLGSPYLNWNGGAGQNGVYYNHCIVDSMLGRLPLDMPPPNTPLRALSFTSLQY